MTDSGKAINGDFWSNSFFGRGNQTDDDAIAQLLAGLCLRDVIQFDCGSSQAIG